MEGTWAEDRLMSFAGTIPPLAYETVHHVDRSFRWRETCALGR
jgi:hypothetical protein